MKYTVILFSSEQYAYDIIVHIYIYVYTYSVIITPCADTVLSLHTGFRTAACFQKDADSLKRIGSKNKNRRRFSVLSGKKTPKMWGWLV